MQTRSHTVFVVMLLVAAGADAGAAPLTTALTYQGQLKFGGAPADGSYDFEFRLFDLAAAGAQQGSMVPKSDLVVANGLFTVSLDFGQVFDGNRRWLEIRVRDGASIGAYTPLTPRQELSAAPYALYALNGPGGSGPWQASGANIFNTNAGNVGIGTNDTTHRLTVAAPDQETMRLLQTTTGYGEGARLNFGDGDYAFIEEDVDDALLIQADRIALSGGEVRLPGGANPPNYNTHFNYSGDGRNYIRGTSIMADSGGNVGIGTSAPLFKLHVEGDEFLSGNAYFGERTGQMLNLYGTGFGIGIQDAVLYNRSGGAFYWFQGGTHQNATGNAGGGLALLSLDQLGIHFGARLGQFVRLYEDGVNYYGSGVQAGTHYFRTGGQPGDAFAWHKGGVHNDNPRNPGGGQTLMTLDGENGLAVSGNATQAREKGGFVKAMAKVNADGSIARQYSASGGNITASYNASYNITFPFQVNDRYVSVTPLVNFSVFSLTFAVSFNGANTATVTFYDPLNGETAVANEFFIFVY